MEDMVQRVFEHALPGINFGMFRQHGGTYSQSLRAYSIMMFQDRPDVDQGGKVILPSSSLERLTHMNVRTPMLFKLYASSTKKTTHAGVLEFTAPEGHVLLPSWLMRYLQLEEGAEISVAIVQLPTATFSKFKPLQHEFLDISNPKAVLEQVLRFFACLTKDDIIAVHYNNKVYEMLVVECRPADAVSIIECDMQVDFDSPDGYGTSASQMISGGSVPSGSFLNGSSPYGSGVASSFPSSTSLMSPMAAGYRTPQNGDTAMEVENEKLMVDASSLPDRRFEAFSGSGRRLGGPKKSRKSDVVSADRADQVDVYSLSERGIPNFNWRPGHINFRRMRPQSGSFSQSMKSPANEFSPFGGQGVQLKRPK